MTYRHDHALEEGLVLTPKFNADGLVTAVVTDRDGHVLMVAHMNAQALDLTIETGYAHYWSRSRQSLWKKGESSGHLQQVRDIRIDCDQDAVWLIVDQVGDAACHTGRKSCFYRRIAPGATTRELAFVDGSRILDQGGVS
jgi:phosphoribosyl-AMP cyclohydrolase